MEYTLNLNVKVSGTTLEPGDYFLDKHEDAIYCVLSQCCFCADINKTNNCSGDIVVELNTMSLYNISHLTGPFTKVKMTTQPVFSKE